MCSKDKRGGGKHVKQYLFIQRREARGNFHSKSRPALILVRQPPFPASPQTPQKEKCAHAAEKKKKLGEQSTVSRARTHASLDSTLSQKTCTVGGNCAGLISEGLRC